MSFSSSRIATSRANASGDEVTSASGPYVEDSCVGVGIEPTTCDESPVASASSRTGPNALYITVNPEDIQQENILFLEKRRNMIISGHFTKVIYSDHNLTMNAIYVPIYIDIAQYKNISKYSCYVVAKPLPLSYQKLNNLEANILLEYIHQHGNRYNITPVYSLSSQLKRGTFKIYYGNSEVSGKLLPNAYGVTKLIVKLSGVWESDNKIGVTFKVHAIDVDR